MKCLSLKQPYAELIMSGKKTIENRHWKTNYRGPLLIHASANVDKEACRRLGLDEASLVKGAIVGKVNIVDVVQYDSMEKFLFLQSKHFGHDTYFQNDKTFGFILTAPQKIEKPVSMKGRLGMFEAVLTATGNVKMASRKPLSVKTRK